PAEAIRHDPVLAKVRDVDIRRAENDGVLAATVLPVLRRNTGEGRGPLLVGTPDENRSRVATGRPHVLDDPLEAGLREGADVRGRGIRGNDGLGAVPATIGTTGPAGVVGRVPGTEAGKLPRLGGRAERRPIVTRQTGFHVT